MKKHLLLLALLLFQFSIFNCQLSIAQTTPCGTSQMMRNYMNAHPGYQQQFAASVHNHQQAVASMQGGEKSIKYIPIVFHVIYNTSAENVSDASIQASLQSMNDDYRKLNADFSQTRAQFQGVAADAQIQFCLATKDPNGNTTTGIIRTPTTKTGWDPQTEGDNMKSTAYSGGQNPWPFDSYYNVWIVALTSFVGGSGTAGYAYYPGLGPTWESVDGTVVDYQTIDPAYRILSHETGHYLGLLHPWEDANQNTGCNNMDGFTDTPNTDSPTFDCPPSGIKCSVITMWENFMDYSQCPRMFTQQQVAYMNNVLSTQYDPNNGITGRLSLLSSLGCQTSTPVAPVAAFTGTPLVIPVGSTVTYTDNSTNNPTSWSWSFPGGTPSTSTSPGPVTVTYSAAGTYNASLTVTNSAGNNSLTRPNYVIVTTSGGGGTVCDTLFRTNGRYYYVAPADSAGFQIHEINNNTNNVPNPGLPTGYTANWMLFYSPVTIPGDTNFFLGSTSWFVDTTQAADNWFDFGSLNIPAGSTPSLKWEHLMPDNNFRDGYEVRISTVGNSIANFQAGTQLISFADNVASTDGDTVWTPQNVSLSAYAGQTVWIAFHHNANNQYMLYLDNIRVEDCITQAVAPIANFVGTPTTITACHTVTYTDASSNTPTSWSWSFPGGSPSSSTSPGPITVTYNTAGTYNASLTATNSAGTNTDTQTNYVTVTGTCGTITCDTARALSFGYDSLSIYSVTAGGYVAGNNYYGDLAKAEAFTLSTPKTVQNVILWFGKKKYTSGNASSGVTVKMYDMTGTGTSTSGTVAAPGTVLASVLLPVSQIDTLLGNTVSFPSAISVSSNYAVGIDLTTLAAGDTVGLVTTKSYTINNLTQMSWEKWSDQTWNTMRHAWGLAIDLFIFPIECSTSLTDIPAPVQHPAISLYPNPVNAAFTLDYLFPQSTDMKVKIYNSLGELIYENNENHTLQGKVNIDISANASGIYFMNVITNDNTWSKKIMLRK